MNYSLRVNGIQIPLWETTVFPIPFYKKETMPFAILPLSEPADIEITSEIPLHSVVIRPKNLQIPFTFDEHTIRFRMEVPKKISVEINGSIHNNLAIFAGDIPNNYPDLSGKHTIRYPAGEYTEELSVDTDNTVVILEKDAHLTGRVYIQNCQNTVLLLEEGAVLHGKLEIRNTENTVVCGYGIINASVCQRGNPLDHRCVKAGSCRNLTIRDITLLDSCTWSCEISGSDNVHIDNLNIIGGRGNSDGVDICGSRHVLVEKCFIRNWDDGFTVKAFDTGDAYDIVFRDSVLWNDFARPIEVGVEIRADSVKNVKFENIDVIHVSNGYPVMGIHHGDRAHLSHIEFSNIRIEDAPGAQLFDLRITNSVWNKDTVMGDIEDVWIHDIYLQCDQKFQPSHSRCQGFSENNRIRNVRLENICMQGRYAATLKDCLVDVLDFAENVTITAPVDQPLVQRVATSVTPTVPFSLRNDGFYYGTVEMMLTNTGTENVSGKATLNVSPANMVDIPDSTITYTLAAGETISSQYPLCLQPGKYVLSVQSCDPTVEASWLYQELRVPIGNSIDSAPAYKMVNYGGLTVEGIQMAAADNKLILRADALREHPFAVYTAIPVEPAPGEAKFSVEETCFGEAMAIMDGRHGLEAAPQLRCPEEITMVFFNGPKVKKIHSNIVGGAGTDTVEIPFAALGIPENAKEVWLDIAAQIPEASLYRFPLTLFHSMTPGGLAHMFGRADILD